MWLDDIADYYEAKRPADLAEVRVFIHTMPANEKRAIMFAGSYNGMPVDAELPGFHKGPMQVVVRATKSSDAEQIAQAVSDAIETEVETIQGNLKMIHIRPRHLPVPFPRSGGDYYEAVVNFDVCFARLSA